MHYRLYCVDGAGKITTAEWLEADDDGQALQIARDMGKAVACELWQRARFVARIGAAIAAGAESASAAAGPAPSPLRR